ncbi:MAG: hypothetical protein E7370_00595 [Clostridiales bacterium]|nr:hypothetical protein [Clostridiales bacterium]
MKKKKIFLNLISLLFICVLFGLASINLLSYNSGITAYAHEITANENEDFAEDSIVVVLTKEATRQFLDYTVEDFKEINAIAVYDLTAETVGWVEKQVLGIPTQEKMLINIENFRRILKIQISENNKENVSNAISILEQREDVESASPNYILKTNATSNDIKRNFQWGLNNISINEAWNISTGTDSVLVGVIDSGIDASHIDLTDNIHRKSPHTLENTLHRDFTTGTADGTKVLEPDDLNGHGTHVAGIIGAKGNNAEGCAGVTWNIDLVSLRIFNENGNGSSGDLVEAIQYAAKCNIKILNYSGGSYNFNNKVKSAIDSYEGLVVCSAGNEANNNDVNAHYPSDYDLDNIISVGAIDQNGDRSSFSNYGENSVHVYAPGGNILSTLPNNTYGYMSGTSMAAPFVTGTAALMLSIDPSLSGEQLKEAILNNCDYIEISIPDGEQTVKKLNAFSAVNSIAYKTNEQGNIITELNYEPTEEVYLPSIINGVTITGFESQVFSGWSSLESITIPATITSIGADAFLNCTSLQNVTFEVGSQLTSIGYNAFASCINLGSIKIPSSVTSIGSQAFIGCSNLEKVIMSRQTTIPSLGTNAFNYTYSGLQIYVPNTLENSYKTATNWSSYANKIQSWYIENNRVYITESGTVSVADQTELVTLYSFNLSDVWADYEEYLYDEAFIAVGGSRVFYVDCFIDCDYGEMIECSLKIEVEATTSCILINSDKEYVAECFVEDGILTVPYLEIYNSGEGFYLLPIMPHLQVIRFEPSDIFMEYTAKIYV